MAFRSGRLLALVAIVAIASGCFDPAERRPGTWLSGTLVESPVEDWSFANEHPQLQLQTATWYGIPHSVTILGASRDGRLFIGARDPATKRWVANVGRDPRVRIRIGDGLYPGRLVPLEDGEQAYPAYAAKYDWPEQPEPDAPPVRYFELLPPR